MIEQRTMLLIPKIENGIVIDHIPAGKGMIVLEILHGQKEIAEAVTTIGLNYKSKKLGAKDIIKLNLFDMPDRVLQHLSILCPGISIKRIKDYAVDKCFTLCTPDSIEDLLRCRNPQCITNVEENSKTMFNIFDRTHQIFCCRYCERTFKLDELELIK